ncbi:MAG: AmmeMemoRadiSam system protein A [Pseudomonadota bacterium]
MIHIFDKKDGIRQVYRRLPRLEGMTFWNFRRGLRALITMYLLSVILVCLLWIESQDLYAKEAGICGCLEKAKEGEMPDRDQLTQEEGKYLLSVARKTIGDGLLNQKGQAQSHKELSPRFSEKRGTFVTLTLDDCLRGCIGHIIPQESLLEGIQANAINAAFRDPRFRPLSKEEFERTKIEISILTEPKTLEYADGDDLLGKLRPGIDGLIIKKGFRQATFLPQVWDQLPDKRAFLGHLCLKAGLDEDAWNKEKLEVSTYQVQAFDE